MPNNIKHGRKVGHFLITIQKSFNLLLTTKPVMDKIWQFWQKRFNLQSFLFELDNQGYPYIWPSHCKDSQKITLKLYSIVTHFVNFKHNFHKDIETFFKNKLKWIQEICFKMNPLSSELPFHVRNWLIISLKDFCIVIRKWPTFLPSIFEPWF